MARAAGVVGAAQGFSARQVLLLGLAILCLSAAILGAESRFRHAALMAGLVFSVLVVLSRALITWSRWQDGRIAHRLAHLTGEDAAPCFSTDAQGQIRFLNRAASLRFGPCTGATLISAMQDHFASPAAVLYRLQGRAAHLGAAREDVVTQGGHLRLSVHRIGQGRYLWRLEEFTDRPGIGRGAELLGLPTLVANKGGTVLFANEALRRFLDMRPKRLDQIFAGPAPRPGEEVELRGAAGPLRAILAEVAGPGERREIYLFPVPERTGTDAVAADFEHVPVALATFAPDGTLRAANRAARDLLALAPDQASFAALFEGLGRSMGDWLSDVAHERSPGGAEVLRQRGVAEDRFFQITLRRLVENGRPGVLAVISDATALKTLEAQFVQSQKMQAIGQLAGGVAHDFNNLLTAISGHCDLLLLRHDRTDPDFADLVQIHQNANRAASLVGQLLAFSRKQTLKPERIDLQEALSDLTHLLNRLVGEKVRLKLAHAPDLGPIRADRRQLEQVVMNLVVNARDALPLGGVIRIETEAMTLREDMHRDRAVVPAGDYAVIRVIDGGIGIPPERLRKIFEPFFTTKRPGEGTGLGLSTAYGIVKQSGGFIFVDSAPGKGSTFQLFFPVHHGAADDQPAERVAPVTATPRNDGVVLLVEDEAPVRAFASRALRMRGYTVLEAENAEDALRTLADDALAVDVFVTDVVMPGMDGPSWVRLALQHRPEVKVIFVSGYAEESFLDGQAPIPNSVFLAKPFSLTDLAATVESQLA